MTEEEFAMVPMLLLVGAGAALVGWGVWRIVAGRHVE
jgi:hypothetical protein